MNTQTQEAPARREVDIDLLLEKLKRQSQDMRQNMVRTLMLSPIALERFIKAPDYDPLPHDQLVEVEAFVNGEYVLDNSTGRWVHKPQVAEEIELGVKPELKHLNENKSHKDYGCPAEGKMADRPAWEVEEVESPGAKLDRKLTEARKRRQQEAADRANGVRRPPEAPKKTGPVLTLGAAVGGLG